MLKLALGLTVMLAAAVAPPSAFAKSAKNESAAKAEKAEGTAAAPLDKEAQQKLKEHMRLRNHIVKNVKYPATKEEIVTAFKSVRDVKPDDKKWFEETLPSKTYDSSDDVMKALGWEVTTDQPATAAATGKTGQATPGH